VTLRLPRALLGVLTVERLDWLVPGYVRDKVIALLRSMPKEVRRALVPIPDAADRFLAEAARERGLDEQLADFVTRESAMRIDEAALAAAPSPDWLRVRIIVVDDDGLAIAEGRDLARLREQFVERRAPAVAPGHAWEREDVRRWDFGDWIQEIRIRTGAYEVTRYPAIEDAGAAVRLTLQIERGRAARLSRGGIARLATLALAQQHEIVRRRFERDRDYALLAAAAGFGRPLFSDIADRAIATATLGDDAADLPRNAAQFAEAVERARGDVVDTGESVGGTVRATLARLREARVRLAAMNARALAEVQRSIEQHLDRLFAPGWIRGTPADWFQQLPKYAEAAVRRADKASTSATRHAAIEAQIEPYEAALRDLDLRAPDDAGAPARTTLRWMIEEFRVSLYAQDLRTKAPVSAVRLTRLLADARREAQQP
jgi:ATP-dependent helicase HrpA